MSRICVLLSVILFLYLPVSGQTPGDSIRAATDTAAANDSGFLQQDIPADTTAGTIPFSSTYDASLAATIRYLLFPSGPLRIKANPGNTEYRPLQQSATVPEPQRRKINGKEYLFYLLTALFILFAVLRRAFPKYFSDLFRLFFKTTLKQKQLRDQLMQTPLPSLLFNAFFVISGGLYITFLLRHFSINPLGSFWLTFLYACTGLAACYFVKFAGLKICGWLFSMDEAADSYIFIVFIVNKMVGILLLPVLLVLAFSTGDFYQAGLAFSWCLVGGLLLYRFILTFGAIRNQVRLNLFHFFLYICAFEIAPLLLVYKALLIFFNQTT